MVSMKTFSLSKQVRVTMRMRGCQRGVSNILGEIESDSVAVTEYYLKCDIGDVSSKFLRELVV